jgi:RND family efflux transporter MFP subunit
MLFDPKSLDAWLALLEEDREPVFFSAWMSCLVGGLPQLEEAVLVWGAPNVGPFIPVAFWPFKSPCSSQLANVCEQSLDIRRTIQKQMDGRHLIVIPILRAKDVYGVIGLSFQQSIPEQTKVWLQWGVGWLFSRSGSKDGLVVGAELAERMLLVIDGILAALTQQGLTASAQAVATLLAHKLNCDRVSVGLGSGKVIKLLALSNAADFSRRLDLVQYLEATMHESADQGASIHRTLADLTLDKSGERVPIRVTRAHDEMIKSQGNSDVLTVPFYVDDEHFGVWVFEWVDVVSDDQLYSVAEGIAPVVGRVLLDKRDASRGVLYKIWSVFRKPLSRFLGVNNLSTKLVVLSLVVTLVSLSIIPVKFEVSGNATLEGSTRRIISAPVDGFVSGAFVRAGQSVVAGSLLATLDDRQLRLELSRWNNQESQYTKQAQDALAQRNLAQAQIAQAQVEQAKAQRSLVESQLQLTQLVAPFDGVLVSGDLSQSLGAAVQKGQTLFELSPLDHYRLILWVHESDLALLSLAQEGRLMLTALPNEIFKITVTLITPVATVESGENVFRVEANVDAAGVALRPGMQGIGKIEVGETSLLWSWTRKSVAWIRLQVWRWFGI